MPKITTRNAFSYALALVCLFALLRGLAMLRILPDMIGAGDNDNLLRLVQVRDWLGGQSWFDTTQYRLLPPEGVSIHWSRYVDLGIAALIVPLGWVFSAETAELLALMLWPTLLLCILMAIIGGAINRLAGWIPATAAMLMALLWSKIGGGAFMVGSIDHHNVQMICAALIAAMLMPPQRDLLGQDRAAVVAGAAVGFSLAVGLEMLPFILVAWAYAGMRFAFGVAGAGRWLVVFACSIVGFSLLFMAGQTPSSAWLTPYCDVLATPILSLLATGFLVSTLPVALGRHITHPLVRIALMAGVMAVGFWLASPLLAPCLAGPYGSLSATTASIISEWIVEAQPVLAFAKYLGGAVDTQLFPGLVLLVLGLVLGWKGRASLAPGEANALVFTMLILGLGLALSFAQVRALTVGAIAFPLMTGLLAQRLVVLWHASRPRPATLIALLLLIILIKPDLLTQPLRSLMPGDYLQTLAEGGTGGNGPVTPNNPVEPDNKAAMLGPAACRLQESIADLHSLPPSLIATQINLGMAVLAYSDHSATTAPYHRSADAFWNGLIPLEREAAMLGMLRKSGADYLILCRVRGKGKQFAYSEQLLDGKLPAWLEQIDPSGKGQDALLAVYRVNKEALAADPQTPENLEP